MGREQKARQHGTVVFCDFQSVTHYLVISSGKDALCPSLRLRSPHEHVGSTLKMREKLICESVLFISKADLLYPAPTSYKMHVSYVTMIILLCRPHVTTLSPITAEELRRAQECWFTSGNTFQDY